MNQLLILVTSISCFGTLHAEVTSPSDHQHIDHQIELNNDIPLLHQKKLEKLFYGKKYSIFDIASLASTPAFKIKKLGNILKFPHPDGDQIVVSHNKIEAELIKRSSLSTSPVEVGIFVAHTKDGKKITMKNGIFGSLEGEKINSKTMSKNGTKFLNWLFQRGTDDIRFIELVHTHPAYDAKSDTSAVIAALNNQDLAAAKAMSSQLDNFPVMVTAAVPNGYSYKAIVRGNKNITFQSFR